MKGKQRFWQFRAAADDPKVGELLLYGPISSTSWWGDEVTPSRFKADLDALGEIGELRVFINSGGGDVFAGQAIYTMLKRHPAQVTVYVDGLAASIASVIAMAGDRIVMPVNAMMMIHQPYTLAVGNATEFRKLADDLDKISESIIVVYQEKTGLSREQIVEMMDAETWMTAQEAVEMGFADELEETKQVAASVQGRTLVVNGEQFDLSQFKNPPKLGFLPAASSSTPEPPSNPTPAQRRVAPLSLYERRLKLNEKG